MGLVVNGYPNRVLLRGNTLDRVATQALNYRDDAIARGLGYFAYYNQTIAAGAKSYILFRCPTDRYTVLLGRENTTNKELLYYRAYSSYAGGTIGAAIPIKNLRTDTAYSSNSQVNVITGATPTAGTDVTNFPIFGSVGAGNRVVGGTDSSDTFRLLAPNTSFLIEFENASTSAIMVYTQYTWFELSPQVIL